MWIAVGATVGASHRLRSLLPAQEGSGAVSPTDIDLAFPAITAEVMKRLLFEEGLRPSGLGARDVPPTTLKKNFLPGVHGSR